MKLTTALLALAASLALTGPLPAESMLSEVKPGHPEAAGFTVDITRARQPDGAVKFRVTVTEKGATFSSKPSMALGTVKITDHTSSVGGSQALSSERKERSLVSEFTVPKSSLDNPDLSFVFTNYVEREGNGKLVPMPSADFVYARLKDFSR